MILLKDAGSLTQKFAQVHDCWPGSYLLLSVCTPLQCCSYYIASQTLCDVGVSVADCASDASMLPKIPGLCCSHICLPQLSCCCLFVQLIGLFKYCPVWLE